MTQDITLELASLHDDYTERLNLLLDEGREDLVAELTDRYSDDATRLMCASSAAA